MSAQPDFKPGRKVGQKMPAWKMAASDGTEVDSKDLRGTPYVIFMYPKAHTGG